MNIKTDSRGIDYDACNAHVTWSTGEVFQIVDADGNYDEVATSEAQRLYFLSFPAPAPVYEAPVVVAPPVVIEEPLAAPPPVVIEEPLAAPPPVVIDETAVTPVEDPTAPPKGGYPDDPV